MEQVEGTEPKKKSGTVMLIAAIAILTVVGGAGGWVIGTLISPKIQAVEDQNKAAAAEKAAAAGGHGEAKKEEGLPHIATEANGIVQLEPITTNLAYPSENWIRLEVALMFNGAPDVKIAEDIHQDILAYLRTVSLQQIEGARGFQYLKDDIQERVDLRSEGRVSKVMFRTFVIE
ncbi:MULTISPECIES: flagellar basal body-associated FliL family protein [Alphaproteobacteria]|uniref:Flagellar protein FliL n=2 Tax=Alphaproteobacteria TaxID=28211 RepID=A0A512HDB0_9HYPH|nr:MULTISPECIES: flagellar basal body-associated FliL family protein [Alphaproteobacteria]GEO83438.1 flagellar basal body protein FliL [Ciceribacter naphthalenivorans]GLR24412.1 flagellar basal body protein FliL [Ciceribacter naphthalenivorans]GLT07268.1 flagellar basal body protein FliL [Sphingomonas psychrolutea]